jgi:hypothetical protein
MKIKCLIINAWKIHFHARVYIIEKGGFSNDKGIGSAGE